MERAEDATDTTGTSGSADRGRGMLRRLGPALLAGTVAAGAVLLLLRGIETIVLGEPLLAGIFAALLLAGALLGVLRAVRVALPGASVALAVAVVVLVSGYPLAARVLLLAIVALVATAGAVSVLAGPRRAELPPRGSTA